MCRRLQELEEETAALKRQLLSASPAAPATALPSGDILRPHPEEDIHASRIPTAGIRRNEPSADNDPTLSRNIDGLELAPGIIDDCFEL